MKYKLNAPSKFTLSKYTRVVDRRLIRILFPIGEYKHVGALYVACDHPFLVKCADEGVTATDFRGNLVRVAEWIDDDDDLNGTRCPIFNQNGRRCSYFKRAHHINPSGIVTAEEFPWISDELGMDRLHHVCSVHMHMLKKLKAKGLRPWTIFDERNKRRKLNASSGQADN